MSHYTSEANLFMGERRISDAVSVASDALLVALQREHPEIVRRLQERAAAGRAPGDEGRTIWCDHCHAHISVRGVLSCVRPTCQSKDKVPPEARSYRR